MDAERQSVLVVEDDDATRTFLVDNLGADGFKAVGRLRGGGGAARDRGPPAHVCWCST